MKRSSTSTSPSRCAAVWRVRVSGLADDAVDRPEGVGQPARLPAPDVVELRVEAARAAARRRWPRCGRGGRGRARSAFDHTVAGSAPSAARGRSVRPGRGRAGPCARTCRRRTGSARSNRRYEPHERDEPGRLQQQVPPAPLDARQRRRPRTSQPVNGHQNTFVTGEGAVEDEVQERADGQEEPSPSGRPPADGGQHHHDEQHHAERRPSAARGPRRRARRRGRAAAAPSSSTR